MMDKSLSDIYSSSVKGRKSHFSSLGILNHSTQTERDPNLVKLENSVFQQIRELTKEEEPIKSLPQNNNLKTYSVEDAIKELKEMGEL
jgi:hypothetical protein